MHYKQLTLRKRYQIAAYKKAGFNQKYIAAQIEMSESTVSRELKRNSINGRYDPELAERFCFSRHRKKHKYIKMTNRTKKFIKQCLKLDYSPQQISGVMHLQGLQRAVSYETIYRYIYHNKSFGGKLYLKLRHKNKKYHKRSRQYNSRGIIKNRVSIDKRPKIVQRKKRIGDWEIDTVIGKDHQGALVTLVDRKSKFTLIKKVATKHAQTVTQATIAMLEPIKSITHTITSDNGKEFAYHEEIAKTLNTGFYFANPYHSWERGLNEHTNGLIRQYLPKKTDFTQVKNKQIRFIQDRLNNRPRKVLGYKTPAEVFYTYISKKLAV